MRIEEAKIPVRVEYSKRKTIAICVTCEEELLVKIPIGTPDERIRRFLKQKEYWIYKTYMRQVNENKNRLVFSKEEERKLREKARRVFTEKTRWYAGQIGVSYNRIRIAEQKTRWGSCSSSGTISYNWRLILMPENIQNYVVVHELCHCIEMNHSQRFWELVKCYIPEMQQCRNWLKEHGKEYV